MNTITGITVVFEDFGQDFLEFDIKGRQIVAARPFQNDIWSGRQVLNKQIAAGDYVHLSTGTNTAMTVRYRVDEVRPLTSAVQIGPTDI